MVIRDNSCSKIIREAPLRMSLLSVGKVAGGYSDLFVLLDIVDFLRHLPGDTHHGGVAGDIELNLCAA